MTSWSGSAGCEQSLPNLRNKVNFCASEKPAVTESESQGLKARCLSSDVRTDGCDGSTHGWLRRIQARTVSKLRQPVASQLEPTTGKAH